MIISRKHKYLFIETPLTASWAIRHELSKHYAGHPILHKHATYPEFRRHIVSNASDYFVFAAVRNPLDSLVSRYVKLKTNHKAVFTDPDAAARLLVDDADRAKYRAIRDSGTTFERAFREYWSLPYSDMIDMSSQNLDFVIRYENLQDGFSEVLEILSIPQIRKVPVLNKTRGKVYWETYYTAEVISMAKRACGQFMAKWGYEFPPSWGAYRPSRYDQLRFMFVSKVRGVYLERVRYDPGVVAKAIRHLRAALCP